MKAVLIFCHFPISFPQKRHTVYTHHVSHIWFQLSRWDGWCDIDKTGSGCKKKAKMQHNHSTLDSTTTTWYEI